ncbi:MAG: hypothetical protein ACYTF1_10740, partial [Planctomycetota bacterium]
ICDPSTPSSSTISCSPDLPSRPEGALQESEEQRLMKHINQLCLRMLNDPPALMRFLSNPPPYTSGLEEDDDEDDEDDQTNPTSSTDPLFNCSPPLRRRRPPVHGPKTNTRTKEET